MVILGPCKCCTVWQENYRKLLMFIPGLQFVKHANPCGNRLSAPGARARPKADDPMSRLGLHLRRTQESVAWNRQIHLRFLVKKRAASTTNCMYSIFKTFNKRNPSLCGAHLGVKSFGSVSCWREEPYGNVFLFHKGKQLKSWRAPVIFSVGLEAVFLFGTSIQHLGSHGNWWGSFRGSWSRPTDRSIHSSGAVELPRSTKSSSRSVLKREEWKHGGLRFPGKVSDFFCFDFLLVVFGHFFFGCFFVCLLAWMLI